MYVYVYMYTYMYMYISAETLSLESCRLLFMISS